MAEMDKIFIKTKKKREVVDVTEEVNDFLKSKREEGSFFISSLGKSYRVDKNRRLRLFFHYFADNYLIYA